MGAYKWTDGAELYHHGILGQRWGVRRFQNKDGSYTNEGKIRYGRLSEKQVQLVQDTIKSSGYYDKTLPDKVFKITGANPNAISEAKRVISDGLKEKQKISEEVNDLFKDLENDDKKLVPYEVISEIASSSLYFREDATLGDYGNNAYMAIFEDGQQQPINAYSLYSRDNNMWDKLEDLYNRNNEVGRGMMNAAVETIQNALDEVGGEGLSASKNNPKYTVGKALANQMINNMEEPWTLYRGCYTLLDAYNPKSFNDKANQVIENVAKNVKKVANYDDKNTWNYFYEAAENLGMLDKKANDLTDSDWDRINAEIRSIRQSNSR